MLWPDEVRRPDFAFLEEQVEVRSQELAMAGSLIETLSGEFDPSAYKDSYREALEAVIEAKIAGREVVRPSDTQPTVGTVVDLMAALRASVEAAKKGRTPATPATTATPVKAAKAAKAPAKKAGVGAPATKKPAAKRAPARRSA